MPSSLAFSRDRKRVAYMGRPAGGPRVGMFVDGKLVVPQARHSLEALEDSAVLLTVAKHR